MNYKVIMAVLFAAFASVGFCSCSNDDEPKSDTDILGTWICVESSDSEIAHGEGFHVNDALVFFNSTFTSSDQKISGKKCFVERFGSRDLQKDEIDKLLKELTVSKWDSEVEGVDEYQDFGWTYNLNGKSLTIEECDLDRYVGSISINGDELTYTYTYQNWNYDDNSMTEESETYVSKFIKQ